MDAGYAAPGPMALQTPIPSPGFAREALLHFHFRPR